MRRFPLIATLIFTMAFASCSRGEEKTQTEDPVVPAPNPLPVFILKDLNGKEIKSEDYRGKVLMVNFWATWCGPCISEIPDLNEIYALYKDKGFALLGVASQSGSAEEVRRHVERLGIQYPVVMGNDEVLQKYHVFAFPTDYIVDRKGNIRERILGAPPGKKANLVKILDGLLEE